MSANPDLFEHLRPLAYAHIRRQVKDTRVPVDAASLSAFLDESIALYRASGGVSDLTEEMVRDVKNSIARFCTGRYEVRPGYSPGNRALHTAMAPLARDRAKALRRSSRGSPVDRAALRLGVAADVSAYRAIPGQAHDDDGHEDLIEGLVSWYGAMKSVRPEAKPAATEAARASIDFAVWAVVFGQGLDEMSTEAVRAAVQRLRTSHTKSGAVLPASHAAVRGALQRLRGQPTREAAIDALPSLARDIVAVLETEGLPDKRVSVVSLQALADKFWPRAATPAGLRQHRKRLREAAARIEAAAIGLHVAVLHEHVVVARRVRMPADPAAVATARKPRPLSRGLMPRRQGCWGTPEGLDAQATCRVIASQAGDEDLCRVLTVSGHEAAAPAFMNVSAAYRTVVHTDTPDWLRHVKRRQTGDFAFLGDSTADPEILGGVAFVEGLIGTATASDLGQAWSDVAGTDTYRARLKGAAAAPARNRVLHIATVLCTAPSPQAWELAILRDVAAGRPGRRHARLVVPPAPSRPAPTPAAAEAAMPEPVPTFSPLWHPDQTLTITIAEEFGKHWRVDRIASEGVLLREMYCGGNESEAGDQVRPDTAATAMENLRTILRSAALLPTLCALDEELGGTIREGLVAAGIALRDDGDRALPLAHVTVDFVHAAARSVEAARGLRRTLLQTQERYAWHRAQETANAA